ncbi:serine/threonine-protein kinase MRCK beta [Herrania umbratica]|uniref:Serine/threonine-protein kinase MRCK beta n=1 Tax=Herrania umbratica TaxID=108875 RepID=A0A6J0ZJR3_9ROSI|nr:serine/threonine-protein kinase MRCK beta [Herrania umbratica]
MQFRNLVHLNRTGAFKSCPWKCYHGGAVLVAYRAGYLDQYLGENAKVPIDSKKIGFDEKDIQVVSMDLPEQKVPTHIDLPPQSETTSETQGEIQFNVEDKLNETHGENTKPVPEKELPEYSPSSFPSADHSADAAVSSEGNLKKVESETTTIPNKEIQDTPVDNQSSASHGETKTVPTPATADRQQDELSKGVELPSLAPEESQIKTVPSLHPTTADIAEDKPSKDIEAPSSLLDAYHLREKADESYLTSLNRKYEQLSKETEAFGTAIEELNEGYLSKDGKLIFDFLQAIHAAEKRQAELDAHAFAEEKRALKEKYEKELRDLRARELMRTEEAAILDKELKRERTKAAAAIKSLQEKMEEKLKMEIEEKEREAEMKLQKAQELGKAELAAAIASEKAAQIEKMAEANLHINALCMAFYARSEEARKSHSVQKLALGALALEDALSKGLPIQKEIDALRTYLEGIEKDSVLDLVLSSLPEETRYHGTDTLLELNQKFNALKGTLRHFSLIPPGGGGILTHSLAHIATWLKVKEVDHSGEGIESVISTVDDYLAEGKLAEAAAALEQGVKGSQAEEIVGDWVERVRNRAITEQALTVLQSYATCVSLT